MQSQSLVKYDNPALVGGGKAKGSKGKKPPPAPGGKALPPVDSKLTQTEDILNSILPPRWVGVRRPPVPAPVGGANRCVRCDRRHTLGTCAAGCVGFSTTGEGLWAGGGASSALPRSLSGASIEALGSARCCVIVSGKGGGGGAVTSCATDVVGLSVG
jgi:hypothetical protein